MNHLIVSQNNNLEILGSSSNNIGVRIIEKLYDLARAGLDNSSILQGNLQVSKAYRDSVDWLQNNTGLNIVVTDDYFVRFKDANFLRICCQVLGTDGTISETQAASVVEVTYSPTNIVENIDYTVKEVDLNLFPNAGWSLRNTPNEMLHNVHLEKLDFGNVTDLVDNGYIYWNFNQRIASEVIADVCIGEYVERIGLFALRSFIPKELYLPNIKYIGGASGDMSGTITVNGTSVYGEREFWFLGDKLEAFGGLNDSNSESFRFKSKAVITATTPPVWAEWEWGTADDTYTQTSYAKYKMGSWCYYVPDSALNDYKQAPIWSDIWSDWGTECLKPISELPAEYKQKISKWYTIPSND